MNYIGSKKRLAKWLIESMQIQTELRGSFLDAFGGTSIVAQTVKPYMQVTCNDV
jgi:adenine-specific DNA methylase